MNITSTTKDAVKALKGIVSILYYMVRADKSNPSISLFATSQYRLQFGQISRFDLIVYSNRPLDCSLVVDFYLKEDPSHPVGHHAYFGKKLKTPVAGNLQLSFFYDWNYNATFKIDGTTYIPDTSWHGNCQSEGKYLANAFLVDETGEVFEQLGLVQELYL